MFPLSIGDYVKIVVGIVLLSGCFYGYVEHNRFEAYKTEIKNIAKEQEAKNESIKNVKNINVMVNDLLIEDLNGFKIDPKNEPKVEYNL